MTSEDPIIREASFLVYNDIIKKSNTNSLTSTNWNEVKRLIINELGMVSSESISSLAAAISILYSIDDIELIRFICTEDASSNIRSLCTTTIQSDVRHVGVLGFGSLLLKSWSKIMEDNNNSINSGSGINIETILRFDSYSDSRRMKETFSDLVLDLFKEFSLVLMKAGSNSNNSISTTMDQKAKHTIQSMDAYCEVLLEVFDRYNQGFDELGEWIRTLLGCAGTGEEYVSKRALARARANSATIAPLIKTIMMIIGQDLHLLMTRWRQYPCHKDYKRNAYSRLITAISLMLLREMPAGCHSNTHTYTNTFLITNTITSTNIITTNTNTNRL
jgi:hypothetical protein